MDFEKCKKLYKKLYYRRAEKYMHHAAAMLFPNQENVFEYNICSSGLSLLINYLTDNIDSCGIDLECRSIIENAAMVKMMQAGDLTKESLQAYNLASEIRYDKTTLDILRDTSSVNHSERITKLYKNVQDRIEEKLKKFNEITGQEYDLYKVLGSPLLFLTYTGERYTFDSLVKKYLGGRRFCKMRGLFSVNIHPSCVPSDIKEDYKALRLAYIDEVLTLMDEVVGESSFEDGIFPEYDDSLAELTKERDPYLGAYYCVKHLFKDVFKDGNSLSDQLFIKSGNLLADLLLSYSFGFPSDAISKNKTLFEILSVIHKLYQPEDSKYFELRKLAFETITKSKIVKMGLNIPGYNEEKEKNILLNKYLDICGQNIDEEEFKYKIFYNDLYFINLDKDTNYNRFNNEYIDYASQAGRSNASFLKTSYYDSLYFDHFRKDYYDMSNPFLQAKESLLLGKVVLQLSTLIYHEYVLINKESSNKDLKSLLISLTSLAEAEMLGAAEYIDKTIGEYNYTF